MISMKLAMLAGGAFVFACVCGASAVVDFDTMDTIAWGGSGACLEDGQGCANNSPSRVDGDVAGLSWGCKDNPSCNFLAPEPKPVDDQEQARNCEKWDIFGSNTKLCTPWNSEETKPIDGDEVTGLCKDMSCNFREPEPVEGDEVACTYICDGVGHCDKMYCAGDEPDLLDKVASWWEYNTDNRFGK